MVSFVKKINEKSKELKEISKVYYNAANNLVKYINENNKKNITNTDKKIKEINKQIASIDDKIKSIIKDYDTKKNKETFFDSLEIIQKNIEKIGFDENSTCLVNFLIGKKLISSAQEINATANTLQITITERVLGENLKIKFKEGGEYSGTKNTENTEFAPSKGISEVLIKDDGDDKYKKTSELSSTDNFGICNFLGNIYNTLIGEINNINENIESFCEDINALISNLFDNKEYSIEEVCNGDSDVFNRKINWPEYEKKEDNEKQKIDNYLSALLDELKSLNGDIIKTDDVKISNIDGVKKTDAENFDIDGDIININFKKIFDVVDNDRYFDENVTFSGIEGITKLSISNNGVKIITIPNIFFKKNYSDRSLDKIAEELSIKVKLADSVNINLA